MPITAVERWPDWATNTSEEPYSDLDASPVEPTAQATEAPLGGWSVRARWPVRCRTVADTVSSRISERVDRSRRSGLRLAGDRPGQRPRRRGARAATYESCFPYNPSAVRFDDVGAPTVDRSATGTEVVRKHGEPALILSPGRIDPTSPVCSSSRKPLVREFSFNGRDVFVIANQFDTKLADQSQDGRFQFPAQSSAVQRAGQALTEHDFVSQILAVDKKADVVVVGDLNDYQFSPGLSVLKTGTSDGTRSSTLTDLITSLPANQQYTYDFDGVSEVLDHILVSKGVKVHVSGGAHERRVRQSGERSRPAGRGHHTLTASWASWGNL
jgi:hypothetical protein